MKAIKLLPLLLLLAVIFNSCSKSNVKPNTPKTTDTTGPGTTTGIVTGGPGVYVSGYDAAKANSNSLPRVATLWKDGKAYKLSDGTFNAGASSVYADGTNVYVAGFESTKSGIGIAKLWVNGVATNLTDGKYDAKAFSVFVSNGKVYVAGYESSKVLAGAGSYLPVAKLWVNNVATTLSSGAYATSVYVSASDVYVTGSSEIANAMIWKNGVATTLTGSGAQDYPPTSIFVYNKDVYVAGEGYPTNTLDHKWFMKLDSVTKNYLKSDLFVNGSYVYGFPYHIGVIWKNGIADNPVLSEDYQALTYAKSVFVSGGDVYIAGGQQAGMATIWKNGVNTNLSKPNDIAAVYSVFVSGTDVYVAGMATNASGKRVATLWKNGVATNIGNSDNDTSTINLIGGGQASSVFVVKKPA
ncbi:hypothetical protein AAFN85_04355 [Mucilaginibacter sp. CAU 1740]|uniref:hypothetical protein n=1 Tax=Mucilaginibacter sp. CAU 1740 TaxID=3140365 RepID=UPI00325C1C6F